MPDGLAWLAALAAAARCATRYARRRSISRSRHPPARGVAGEEAANRRIAVVCLGMSFWKRRRIGARSPPPPGGRPSRGPRRAAIALAAARGGAIAAWPSRAAPAWPEGRRGRRAGDLGGGRVHPLGGARCGLPAGGLADPGRAAALFRPVGRSDLETLLATADFPPALLARAAALRAALIARGITKYNLGGAAPELPPTPGRRRSWCRGRWRTTFPCGSAPAAGCGAISTCCGPCGRRTRMPSSPSSRIPMSRPATGAAPCRRRRRRAGRPRAAAGRSRAAARPDGGGAHPDLPDGFEALLRGLRVTCWGRPSMPAGASRKIVGLSRVAFEIFHLINSWQVR